MQPDSEIVSAATTFISDAHDAAIYYDFNVAKFYSVGLVAYDTEFFSFGYGNITNGSHIKDVPFGEWISEDDYTVDRSSICGWYYAYEAETGFNAGYAPYMCPKE